MARNDVYLNINALSPADAVVTGQQDMTAATVPELVLGDTPTFNFYFTDNTNVWPSWAGNASYTLTWALSDAVAGDFAPAATTGNATPITGGWSVILPLNSYDLVGLLNTKRVGQPYPVQNLWQQLRVTDPSGNEVTRAMFWTPVRYRAISDTQNTESASPTGGRFVTVNNVNTLTTPTAAQFYAANPVPTSALGTAANGELLIGNGTGFTKATLTAGSGVSITNGSGSITITATDGDITLDDGTAAAPSLKFTADTDTGLFRPSDNVVGISAGGVSRATFGATSAINGTTIPSSKTLVVTTDKLSALAATTSAELAGVISDETGSGALVFANTPTLVTPNIGAATGTSFNLTGSGTLGTTLTVNGTTDSSSKDTGAIVTEGGLGVEKSATIGGNLTVSGTGTSSGNILTANTGLYTTDASLSNYSATNGVYINGNAAGWLQLAGDGTRSTTIRLNGGASGAIEFNTSGSNRATLAANGNFLLGTTIDGGQKLQVSGTGYFADVVEVSKSAASTNLNALTLRNSAYNVGESTSIVLTHGTGSGKPVTSISSYLPGSNQSELVFYTSNTSAVSTEALRINGSQNATFAGRVTINGTGTGASIVNGLQLNGGGSSGTNNNLDAINWGGGGLSWLRIYGIRDAGGGYGGTQYFQTMNGSGTLTTALTLDSSQNATFAGKVTVSKANAGLDTSLTVNNTDSASNSTSSLILTSVAGSWTIQNNRSGGHLYFKDPATSATQLQINNSTGLATFAGSIAIGNTVNTVSPTSPNRTITMVIGGTTYYIHAKTTND